MDSSDTITVVSGLPRSGTSMMMGMLEAGGIAPLTDGIRAADDDNLRGYYEFERAKKLPEDVAWLDDAVGKSVKIISQLLLKLPATHQFRVVAMQRNIAEILASQQRMMERRGTGKRDVDDAAMGAMLVKHLEQVLQWVDAQPNMKLLRVSYNSIMESSESTVERIDSFLGDGMDRAAMMRAVDASLYRQRK